MTGVLCQAAICSASMLRVGGVHQQLHQGHWAEALRAA